jgi:hypothetical protein
VAPADSGEPDNGFFGNADTVDGLGRAGAAQGMVCILSTKYSCITPCDELHEPYFRCRGANAATSLTTRYVLAGGSSNGQYRITKWQGCGLHAGPGQSEEVLVE